MLNLEYLQQLAETHSGALHAQVREFDLAGRRFAFNSQPSIMGVINLSSDSWYRESVCLTPEKAIQRAHVLRAQGAAVIDLGAESTLLQATRADAELQQDKLLPLIQSLRPSGVLISVETYHPTVARSCLEAGAHVLNFTGQEHAPEIYRIVADHQAAVIICYLQGPNVRTVNKLQFAQDPTAAMADYFAAQIDLAQRQGVEKILIDPGLGFYYRNLQDSAQRVRFQIDSFLNAFRLRALGFPVCNALPHAFEYFGEEVRSAEPFFAVLAALGKTDLFRTHEVSRVKAVLDTLAVA